MNDVESHEGVVRDFGEMGRTIPQVAEELAIDPGTSHSWVSRAKRSGSLIPKNKRIRELEIGM